MTKGKDLKCAVCRVALVVEPNHMGPLPRYCSEVCRQARGRGGVDPTRILPENRRSYAAPPPMPVLPEPEPLPVQTPVEEERSPTEVVKATLEPTKRQREQMSDLETDIRKTMKEDVRDALGQHLRDHALQAAEGIIQSLPRAIEVLAADLESPDWHVRKNAAGLFMKYGTMMMDTAGDKDGATSVTIVHQIPSDEEQGADLVRCACDQMVHPAVVGDDNTCTGCKIRQEFKARNAGDAGNSDSV